jgi:acyl-CoA dehydrogenase
MNPTSPTERSFAETALRLGGKSEEEAQRLGAVDKADEQMETLFAPQYQTVNSPIHKAIWEGKAPLELFSPPPLPASAPCDVAMDRSYEVLKRRREQGQLFDSNRKVTMAVSRSASTSRLPVRDASAGGQSCRR